MTVFVKICGIKTNDVLETTISAGADAVGFVVGVPSSPRNISLEGARKLRVYVPSHVKTVLVMVPETLNDVLQAVETVQPDYVQLHGHNFNTPGVPVPIIKGVNNRTHIKTTDLPLRNGDLLLLDAYKEGMHGGTGIFQDLTFSKNFIEQVSPQPVIIAGGLNPVNVADAIRVAKPYGVDVSSGVENKPGVKDAEKIRAFVKAAKNTEMKR